MSDAYRLRERQALINLAWQTVNDRHASAEDKREARARLEQPDVDEDASADELTLDELRVLERHDQERDAIMAAVMARRANGTRRKPFDP
jgi:hypothetical protein